MGEPVVKVSVTVTVEMTEAQHGCYEKEVGGFAALEIAARLRPEMEVALHDGTRWLRWLDRHATVTISKPVHVKTTDEPEGAAK